MARRLILLVGAIVIVVALFLIFRPKSSTPSPQKRTIAVRIHGDTANPATITVNQGDTVTLHVTADRSFELHLHGYNRPLELRAGKTETETIKANLTGSFDMENEGEGKHLITINVEPR